MEEFPYQHILQAGVRDIAHGVRIASANSIDSGTFVTFLRKNTLRYGYAYRNGSNTRVKTLNTARYPPIAIDPPIAPVITNTTLKRGDFVLAFDEELSGLHFGSVWEANNFTPDWFNEQARSLCLNELLAIHDSNLEIDEIVDSLQDLTLVELRKVHDFMTELRG
jgi:hypothetical protein